MEDASAPEDLLRCLRSMKRARRGTRLPTTRNSERLSLTSSRKGVLEVNPQKIARVTGVLFLITYITAIPAFFFYVPVLDDPRTSSVLAPTPACPLAPSSSPGARARVDFAT